MLSLLSVVSSEVFGTSVGWRAWLERLTWHCHWLSISQACPGVWTAGALCGVKAGYLRMMCDLPRHVHLSRERVHLVSLICLADLSVGQRSVHSMLDF